jgi:uncharacterized protein
MRIRLSFTLLAALLAVASCRPEVDGRAYYASIEQWRANRIARLTSETGWTTLVGLHWLSPGVNQLGSAPTNTMIVTPKAPAHIGSITIADGAITLQADPAAGVTIDGKPVTAPVALIPDIDEGGPTIFKTGSVSYQVIRRNDRLGVRIKDSESEARKNFPGIEHYPVTPAFVVDAKFIPFPEPRRIAIPNILGITTMEDAPGVLSFELDGKTYELTPILEQGETDFFIIFRDRTSGKTTYPAGRFLYATPPGPDGIVRIDFNKAYNPPCAFTPFATCPLPPIQNRLPFAVEAGEKNFGHH